MEQKQYFESVPVEKELPPKDFAPHDIFSITVVGLYADKTFNTLYYNFENKKWYSISLTGQDRQVMPPTHWIVPEPLSLEQIQRQVAEDAWEAATLYNHQKQICSRPQAADKETYLNSLTLKNNQDAG